LHQYWHDGTPPEEVARLIALWREVPGFDHRLFDRTAATAFIMRHAGPRVAACFESCAVPAMQADLFRYVAIHAKGGIYVDADNAPGAESLLGFLQGVPVGLLCRRRNSTTSWFCNDACFARRPGHPLFAQLIELACENIEAREGNNVWAVTGPKVINQFDEPSNAHLFEGLTIAWYDDEMRRYIKPIGNLAYKKGPQDWRMFQESGRSIFV
jgi:mannosyltransferase OCH1-like enzyme